MESSIGQQPKQAGCQVGGRYISPPLSLHNLSTLGTAIRASDDNNIREAGRPILCQVVRKPQLFATLETVPAMTCQHHGPLHAIDVYPHAVSVGVQDEKCNLPSRPCVLGHVRILSRRANAGYGW